MIVQPISEMEGLRNLELAYCITKKIRIIAVVEPLRRREGHESMAGLTP